MHVEICNDRNIPVTDLYAILWGHGNVKTHIFLIANCSMYAN